MSGFVKIMFASSTTTPRCSKRGRMGFCSAREKKWRVEEGGGGGQGQKKKRSFGFGNFITPPFYLSFTGV